MSAILLMIVNHVFAAITPYPEDIHFQAEHFAEAAQDARYFAMPWPVGDYQGNDWRPLVSVAVAREEESYATAEGTLLTLGLSTTLSASWSLDLLAYYDRFSITGNSTLSTLSPFAVNGVPLDLPETAIFSRPRGSFVHLGIGAVLSHELDYGSSWRWDVIGGLLVEQLDLQGYRFDYQLTGGADAGATGVLDHSGRNTLVYGVAGLQARTIFAERFSFIPRVIVAAPIVNGDFTARISGADFDLSTESTGASPHQIGDLVLYTGATVRDKSSHFEMDLGAILGYKTYERSVHEGIDSAVLVSVTWRSE